MEPGPKEPQKLAKEAWAKGAWAKGACIIIFMIVGKSGDNGRYLRDDGR